MRKPLAYLAIAGIFAGTACHRTPEPEGRPAPSATPVASPAAAPPAPPKAPSPLAGAHLKWADPPGWTKVSSISPMRLATYKLPRVPGEERDAEMTVFFFGGGQGGSVEANFERWIGQFNVEKTAAQRSERTANGLKIHMLEIPQGTFSGGMRPGEKSDPKEGFGLLGAVVETSGGPYFFKVTGPAKTLAAGRPAFVALLDGVTAAG